jgi:hypothetical protein
MPGVIALGPLQIINNQDTIVGGFLQHFVRLINGLNALLRGNTSNGHITKLEQSRFSFDIYGDEQSSPLRYLYFGLIKL